MALGEVCKCSTRTPSETLGQNSQASGCTRRKNQMVFGRVSVEVGKNFFSSLLYDFAAESAAGVKSVRIPVKVGAKVSTDFLHQAFWIQG